MNRSIRLLIIGSGGSSSAASAMDKAVVRHRPILPSSITRKVTKADLLNNSKPQRRHNSSNPNNNDGNNNNNNNNNNKGGPYLRPYSGSLPSPGYEWCTRCNIPSRQLQKAIGEPNDCLKSLPPKATFGFLGLHICGAARTYYREQLTIMGFLTAVIFFALPAGTTMGLQQPNARTNADDLED